MSSFTLPPSIPTMVSSEELDYLYRLARDGWSGQGDILEMGPWLGGSTWALASGMEDNPHRSEDSRLHVVDNFVWQPFMADRAPLDIEPGRSFRAAFESNLEPKRDLLVVHEASLPDDDSSVPVHDVGFVDARIDVPPLAPAAVPDTVAIAFVDGAKSWYGLVHLMRALAPRLVQRESLIVFQDFKNWSSYWVPLFVAVLLDADPDCVVLDEVLESNSVSFRVGSDLQPVVERAVPDSLSQLPVDRGVELFDRVAGVMNDAGDPVGARIVRLAEATYLGSSGAWDQAERRLLRTERSWPLDGTSLGQLTRARAWLERQRGSALRRTWRLTAIHARRRLGRRTG